MRALAVTLVLGCSHTNAYTGDRSMDRMGPESGPCTTTPCGGTGDALQLSLGAVVIAGLIVAKLWRD